MTGLDRLDWAAGFAITSFGVRVGVRVDDAALLPKLRDRLPPGCRRSRSPIVDHLYSIRAGGAVEGSRMRRFYLGYSAAARLFRTLDEHEALAVFESTVRFDVAVSADRWVFVHAGAVGWKGHAIVMPAASAHGKSRLVEALVRSGATYYSDEVTPIDGKGRVHPFPQPLALRHEAGGSRRVTAAEIGGAAGSAPLPIGLVVLTQYEPNRTWRPREASPGEGVLALLAQTVRARAAPGRVLETLARAVKGASILEGPRGGAEEAARDILRALDAHTPRRQDPLVGTLSQSSRAHRTLERVDA